MSYILDALRRADSERERGAVPGLHSQPVPPAMADDEDDEAGSAAVPSRWAWLAVVMGSVVLGGGVVWFLVAPRQPAVAVAAAPVPLPVQPAATVPTTPPAPVITMPAPALPQLQAPAAPPAAQQERAAVDQPRPAKPAPRASAPVAPAEAEDEPVPSVASLPDAVRRQLPQLTVSGASYSKNPASRMLILNGQVFHEGDKVAEGLVLEQIRLKSAVLSYRGQRYGISF